MRKTRWLSQALILSLLLNAALLGLFLYSLANTYPFDYAPAPPELPAPDPALASLSLPELTLKLSEPGVISALAKSHHIDISRALGSKTIPHQLTSFQVSQLRKFLATERWPYTSHGLYLQLQEHGLTKPTLLQAFCQTEGFHVFEMLFAQSQVPITKGDLLSLICEGSWETFSDWERSQKVQCDLSEQRREALLDAYRAQGSETAARLSPRPSIGELRPVFREQPPASPSPRTHVIKQGESLWLIANKYQISIEKLMEFNGLHSTVLQPGRTLKIP